MITYMVILLSLICIFQFLYILHTHKQIAKLLQDLQELNNDFVQKLFTKGTTMFTEIYYEINSILLKNQKKLSQLKRKDDANKQMLTNLSHDIRTPLASLIGYLEALNNNNADNINEYIYISYKKALALKSLIDMLFEWCKLNSHEIQYQKESCDVNELTREIIIDWIPLFDKKSISLTVNIPDEEYFLMIDKTAYKRIINNLIQNAIYHGQCSHITFKIQKKEQKIVIDISNNGHIIPHDKLLYIFDRLYKCDLSRAESGTGLGLAITKELVIALKGSIHVSSTLENGTHFTILFSQ
ncbi:MAG: HAMP domain-containing histidine kinase [Lachnospiraceae bacterium]|nr:HAMP domain-containing histidine kinase [Lachnospiraceae bacterium]